MRDVYVDADVDVDVDVDADAIDEVDNVTSLDESIFLCECFKLSRNLTSLAITIPLPQPINSRSNVVLLPGAAHMSRMRWFGKGAAAIGGRKLTASWK